ncbi:MAG: putative toxin-antitoxin system toxin component, PIN family [Chloroflexi bacterium]|nr:putative toxin-antitoxin system toxin component, PIN family [Chloroflexota bacterium]
MLKAVIDNNLLVSYALTRNETISRLIGHWAQGTFLYLASPAIIEELKQVLSRPRLRERMVADPQALIDVVEQETVQTPGQLVLGGVCRDPKDEMLIECAVEGQAHYIVSGDRDLLELGAYQGIKIIRPVEFVAILDALSPDA